MSWNLWEIHTRIGTFFVTEDQKNQIEEMVETRQDIIKLPDGASFAAHQYLGTRASEIEDPAWKSKALPAETGGPDISEDQRQKNLKALAKMRQDLVKKGVIPGPRTKKSELQKRLAETPPDQRQKVVEQALKNRGKL